MGIKKFSLNIMNEDSKIVTSSLKGLAGITGACLMTGLYSHQNGQRMLAEGIDSTKTFFSEMLQKVLVESMPSASMRCPF